MLEVWLDYVRCARLRVADAVPRHRRRREVRAVRVEVHAQARAVLAGLIRHLAPAPVPERELEPLAELLSMGMASLVLWWILAVAGMVARDRRERGVKLNQPGGGRAAVVLGDRAGARRALGRAT